MTLPPIRAADTWLARRERRRRAGQDEPVAFMAYARKTFSDSTIAAYEFGFRPEEQIHGVFVVSLADPGQWHVYGVDRTPRTAEVTHRKGADVFAVTGEWPAWIVFNS